ncbi:hypothetical protein [Chitinophaga arvensicola]|uniref:Uncharacterized protein n=1 Tax=Chitinophaga arvensicola TaxID=29529 RepID=A0A1I0SAA1_9BACT|nr:hypothetical protein [Chitinophaga arvensicola]SEW53360.1 hypothetical protein SAMN04488122_5430 [Chitinophaga arvensicola]
MILLCCFGCRKEEKTQPSPDVPDAFVRHDNSANATDHQIYLYYKETGIAILYNDTVAANPLVTLNLWYHLTVIDSLVTFTRLTNEADILQGINFIKHSIVPFLGTSMKPYAFFLTDSLYTYDSPWRYNKVMLSSYRGLKAVALGFVSGIRDMDAIQRKAYQVSVFKAIFIPYLNANSSLLTEFYKVSATWYGKTANGTQFNGDYIPYRVKEEYGFLSDGTESDDYYSIGTQADDLDRYLTEVLGQSAASFTDKYGQYPQVMKKYKVLREVFTTLGFTMPE